MKKRIICILSVSLVILLISVSFFCTSVLAADKSLQLSAAVSNTLPTAGESIDYTLSLGSFSGVSSGIRAYKIVVIYDSRKLSVSSVIALNTDSSAEFSYNASAAGTIILLYADLQNGASPMTEKTTAKITFTVKNGVSGTATIAASDTQSSFIDCSNAKASPTRAEVQVRYITASVSGTSKSLTIATPAVSFGRLLVNETAKTISNVKPGTTIDDFTGQITNASDILLTGTLNGMVTTGTELSFYYNGLQYAYTVVIYGDVNSDSAVTVLDAIAVKMHLLNSSELTGVKEKAAKIIGTSNVDLLDLLLIKEQILGNYTIPQNVF